MFVKGMMHKKDINKQLKYKNIRVQKLLSIKLNSNNLYPEEKEIIVLKFLKPVIPSLLQDYPKHIEILHT